MHERILFVDDEPNVLAAFRRQLRTQFQIETANSGPEALDRIAIEEPFAIIISDLRMPGMDGVQFLTKAKGLSPDSIRILLTGHADLNTAIEAVNNGHIFRFLTKPCPPDVLASVLQAGLEQHRLVTCEHELLAKTLNRSVQLLTEILSLASPTAFSQAIRLRKIVERVVSTLGLANAWQYELAATLSQIGYIALPPALIEKLANHEPLSPTEERLFASHPIIGYRLLGNIPRLEIVASMIKDQNLPFGSFPSPDYLHPPEVSQGAQLLKVALGYEQLEAKGLEHSAILQQMRCQPEQYHPKMVTALGEDPILQGRWALALATLETTQPGMVMNENVVTRDGRVIVPKGFEINDLAIERLRLAAQENELVEPFRVFVALGPKSDDEDDAA